ncbi:hypothetical protein AOQ84DRAFT_385425 [Glonium stellatum]|uniref:Uncharacterized protein n=1 Tax=Glonium stellatum TaxID=574774 RepID=A0A8E2JXM8_9PEZI|nr:hypothetical protein AOQ84DRAFT_385425 [Glonium stellatum]
MQDIWQLADIEETRFAAAASLLAIRSQQQADPVSAQLHDDDDDSEGDEITEEESMKPTARLNQASQKVLKDKFLDRLGEVLAREKTHVQLKQHYLATWRTVKSSETSGSSEEHIEFRPKAKTVLVSRLPADGKEPELVPIGFYAPPKKHERRIREYADYMPDFHRYWGSCQLDRRFRRVGAEKQEIESQNGQRFWYGDAFIVRFSQQINPFVYDVHDVPVTILHWHSLKLMFRNMWEESFLEQELGVDQYQEGLLQKTEVDKNILFERMTHVERGVLRRFPPNTLELLADFLSDSGKNSSGRVAVLLCMGLR